MTDSKQPVRFGLVGVQGFAGSHLRSLGVLEAEGLARLDAVVIRPSDLGPGDPVRQEFAQKGVRIHDSFADLLSAEAGRLDVIAIPCGIHEHRDMSVAALEAGFHVMCEKPAAGTPEEARQMAEASFRTRRILAIGFQNIHSPSLQTLKSRALEETWGPLEEAWSYALWPRTSAYYRRNPWAGKDVYQGRTIHDSPIQNGVAHYLQNLLWVAGPSLHESATPVAVRGGNWTAKDIEGPDTQFVQVRTGEGIPLYFAASHAVDAEEGPLAWYRFKDALAEWRSDGLTVVRDHGGRELARFGNEGCDIHTQVFRDMCTAFRTGVEPPSTIHNAWQHVWCVHHGLRSSRGPRRVDPAFLQVREGAWDPYAHNADPSNVHVVVRDMEELIRTMARKRCGFAEAGAPWAAGGDGDWVS